jgi:hypothetical protein
MADPTTSLTLYILNKFPGLSQLKRRDLPAMRYKAPLKFHHTSEFRLIALLYLIHLAVNGHKCQMEYAIVTLMKPAAIEIAKPTVTYLHTRAIFWSN